MTSMTSSVERTDLDFKISVALGWVGDRGANMRGNDLLSSPAVSGKCRACDIVQIYPCEIYSYKEQGYDSQ